MKKLHWVILFGGVVCALLGAQTRGTFVTDNDNDILGASNERNYNQGHYSSLRMKSWNQHTPFIMFNCNSIAGARVLSCTLRVQMSSDTINHAPALDTEGIEISTIIDTMYEGTVGECSPTQPGICGWTPQNGASCYNFKRYYPTSPVLWKDTPGYSGLTICAGFNGSRINSTPIRKTFYPSQVLNVPIDRWLAQDIIDRNAYGLALRDRGGAGRNYTIYSREASGTDPTLIINYIFDSISPDGVTGLSATTLSTSSVRLNWTGSSTADADSVFVVYRTDGYPTTKTDGTKAIAMVNVASSAMTTDVLGLTDNTLYYFSVFVCDQAYNFSSAANAQATTQNGSPTNTLHIVKTDSSSSSFTFHCTGDSSLPSDVNNIYVWVTTNKNAIINKTLPSTDTVARTSIKDNQTIAISSGTKYYVGVIPRDNTSLFSDSIVIDSFYRPYLNPITFTLSQNIDSGFVYANFVPGAINGSIDSVYIFYPDTGYVKNQFGALPDTSFTLAQFQALPSGRLIVRDFVTGRHYFSLTIVDNVTGVSVRSIIAGTDTHSIATNFVYPPNPVEVSFPSVATTSILYEISNCVDIAAEGGIDTVLLFLTTDSSLYVNYRTLSVQRKILRATIDSCNTYTFSGCQPGLKYYVGTATKNSLGNWSKTVNVYPQYTKLNNTVRVAAYETPYVCDNTAAISILNRSAIGANIDLVKIYYSTVGYEINPLSGAPNVQVAASAVLADSVVEIPGLEPTSRYFFTITLKDNENGNSWAAIDSTVNGATMLTETYGAICVAPGNPFWIHASSVGDTAVTFSFVVDSSIEEDVERSVIFIGTDSGQLAANYTSMTPWRVGDTINRGPFTVDTLHDLTAYFFGVAVQDTFLMWSAIDIKRITTVATPPENRVVFDSLRAGGSSASSTNRIYIYWSISGGAIPDEIKFLYRYYSSPSDTPTAYNDPNFTVLYSITPTVASGLDSITELRSIQYNCPYAVAAYVKDSRGVWSTEKEYGIIQTIASTDTIPPAQLAVAIDLVSLGATAIRMKWNITPSALTAAKSAENNKLRLGYDFNKSGLSAFDKERYPYRFFVDAANFSANDSIDITAGIDPNSMYYFSAAPVDSASNAALSLAVSRDSVATMVAGFSAGTVTASINAYNNFTIDWSAAMVADGLGGHVFSNDASVRYITIVATDTGYYYGAMPLSDGLSFSSGVAFYSGTFPIDSMHGAITDIELYRGAYYLTAYASVSFHAYGSNAATVGSATYVLSSPHAQDLSFAQINDSIVRLVFSVQDTNVHENSARVWGKYGKDNAAAGYTFSAVALSGPVLLSGDTVSKGVACTSYVNVNQLGFAANSDTEKLYLRLYLSDMVPPAGPADDSTLCSLTVDRKGPSDAAVSFTSDFIANAVACSVTAGASHDLGTVSWGATFGVYGAPLAYTAPGIGFFVSNPETVYVQLRDIHGNIFETAWFNFTTLRVDFAPVYPAAGDTTLLLDNNVVELTLHANSLINDAYKNSTTLWIGRSVRNQGDIDQMTALGIANLTRSKYWFLTKFGGASVDSLFTVNPGLGLKIHFNPTLDGYNDSLKIFRVFSDGAIECLGGAAQSVNATDAYVALDGFVMEDFWKQGDGEDSTWNQDSYVLMLGVDRRAPAIVAASTSFDYANSVVRIGIRDNTVNLDVKMKVITFRGDGASIDTVCVNTKQYASTAGGHDTLIAADYAIGQWMGGPQGMIDLSGIFWAGSFSDGRFSNTHYLSPQFVVDSATGVLSNLFNSWRIVNMPCSLVTSPSNQRQRDFLVNIPEFAGKYDKSRMKLLRLRSSGAYREYSASDTGFYVGNNQAFLLVTGYSNLNSIPFKTTGKAIYRGISNSRGYKVGAANSLGQGWHLLSLPFRGTVRQSSIERVSVHSPAHSAFLGRMWSLTNNTFSAIQANHNMPSGEQGFLTYLFAGDTLFAPVTDDAQYLPGSGVAGKGVSMSWSLGFSVSSNGAVVDGLNEFGEGYDEEFSGLVFPGSVFACGFKGSGPGLQSVVRRGPAGGLVSTWDYVVENHGSVGADISFGFAGMDGLPSGYMVYIEDGKQGYGSVVGASGTSSWYVGSGERRVFRIVVGDGGYISRSVVKQLPVVFSLDQNYPNPFNPVTTIGCAIPSYGSHIAGSVLDVSVYDVQGRLVQQVSRAIAEPGYYHFVWRADDMDGREVGSGVYMYRMIVQDGLGRDLFTRTRKMMMMK